MSEIDKTHEERKLNRECGQAIEKAIRETYVSGEMAGTGTYDTKAAAKTVIDIYGTDRVADVLAENINYHNSDGRISSANKEWAQTITVSDRPEHYFDTHIAIIEMFANNFRKVVQEQEQQRSNQRQSKEFIPPHNSDVGKYLVKYSGNTTIGFEFESDSSDALKHLQEHFIASGNDTVTVYDAEKYEKWDGSPNTAPIISAAEYSLEDGGKFYETLVNSSADRTHEAAKNVHNYLIGKMGFDKDVVKSCIEQGLVYQTEVYSEKFGKNLPCAVFAGFDKAGEMQSAVIKGFGTYEKIAPGSQLKYAFVLPAKENQNKHATAVSVFESPMEVLAGASLAKMNSKTGYDGIHRISVLKSDLYSTHVKALKNFLENNPNVRTVNLCLTNSNDGRVLADKMNIMLKELGEERGETFKVNDLIPADAKGYMDRLQNKNNEVKEKRQSKEKRGEL